MNVSGGCPAPFLDESLYPASGGYLIGRTCALNPLSSGNDTSTCCIPCPVYDYLYDDSFKSDTDAAAWINIAGFILCAFLLLSMAVLPPEATKRSFLNILILISVLILELGFMIPLARQPDQCYNDITPHDMSSSLTCAFSGAFVTFGLMMLVVWVLVRAFLMYLQIYWSITAGKKIWITTLIICWSIIIALVTAVLIHAGVSFRFGGYCYTNHHGSVETYWAWLIALGGISCILQILTFAYCIKVFVANAILEHGKPSRFNSTTNSSRDGSSVITSPSVHARAAARRVRLVLVIQWRSLVLVTLVIFTTAFVSTSLITQDRKQESFARANLDELIPWITCSILNPTDHDKCLALTRPIIVSQQATEATIFILSLLGIEIFLLLCRSSVFKGWRALLKPKGNTARPHELGTSGNTV